MTMKRTQAEQLKVVPDPLENQQRAARKPERETYNVYRLPTDDDDVDAEKEFLLTLPVDVDVERRIKREYGAGSYRVERRRAGRFVSVTEMHFDEPLPSREDVNEREGSAPEDLAERLVPVIAQVVENVLEARRIERERAKLLRPNPSPRAIMQTTEQAQTPADPVGDALRLLREFKKLEAETAAQSPAATTSAPQLSDEDRVTLALFKNADLLGTITSGITRALTAATGGKVTEPEGGIEKVLNFVERNPKVVASVDSKIDRVVNYFTHGKNDDDEESSEETPLADQVLELARARCAANEPITLDDPLLVKIREQEPEQYQELLFNLQNATVDQLITAFGAEDVSFALILKAPHAREWVSRLKELVAAAT
jgi:hypothetical protein